MASLPRDGSRSIRRAGTARLWRTKTGETVGERLHHNDFVVRTVFAPHGNIVAAASLDSTVRLWDAGRSTPLGTVDLKDNYPHYIVFSPNGSLLLIAFAKITNLFGHDPSPPMKIRIWDVAAQQEVIPGIEVSPGIREPLRVRFRDDGRLAVGFSRRRALDLTPDPRPAGDLVKLAQLYSGQRLDAQGGITRLGAKELQALWHELSAKYPKEFAASSEAGMDWRIGQLQATASDRPVALALHRRWLAAQLAESGWQPGERGNETLARDNYIQRLYALAQHGRHAEAVAAADALAARWPQDHETLYGCACVHALAAGAVKDDAALSERYAARAVALLRQAVGAGFKDAAHMAKERDLDALRDRADFQQFVAGLEKKMPPKPKAP